MNTSHSIPSTVSAISFSFLTADDIRRISVKKIVNPVLLDDLNRPNPGGLYDPALGPSDSQDICATCRQTSFTCPGHFGHIELPAPVFHPLFMTNMYNLLQGTCMFCHRFKISRTVMAKYIGKLRLLEHGLLDAALAVDELTIKKKTKQGGEKDADKEDGDADVLEDDEQVEAFQMRIHLWVNFNLGRVSTMKKDQYKDGMVYQARKAVFQSFLKDTALKKCQNSGCYAFAHSLRKEKHTKIIEYDLSEKQKLAQTVKRPNVLLQQEIDSFKGHKPNAKVDREGDVDMSDPEEGGATSDEGEGISLEEEEDDDGVRKGGNVHQIEDAPRAANGRAKTSRGRNERVVAPEECRAHLRRLFQREPIMCSLLFGRHGPFAPLTSRGLSVAHADMFFLAVLPVTPTRFRPPAKMGEILFEHPQNELLSKVLQTSYRLRDLNIRLNEASEKKEGFDEVIRRQVLGTLLDTLIQLQVDVNSFMDSGKNPAPMRQGKLPPAGIKQLLEKKEGLFRKHMMGKRVNYAARSVISPDVNIEPNEIGIPPVFAKKLTFPEAVTAANLHELRQCVINGPHAHPGASMVEYEDGRQQSLDKLTLEQRTSIANQLFTPQEGSKEASLHRGLYTRTPSIPKKVYRHLRDGDILILNRQPTLHKPSMMAHRARVLHGEKTIRMHYANCNSYNADFDGDEMNIHFPQNHVARSEASFIANTDNQYLAATSGKPLRGLIQDHVVAGVWMTSQDAFFTREEYFQLLYGAVRPEDGSTVTGKLETLPPTIWKPRPLWTGKQIISTILLNITPDNAAGLNLRGEAKIPGHLWREGSTEDKVVFLDGELMAGVLDKSAFGASDFGLVHSVYELYGSDCAGTLLGILSRLFTKFLQHRAFTCRMDDLVLTKDGNAKRADILRKGSSLGTEAAIENFPSLENTSKEDVPEHLVSLLEDVLRDDNKMAGLDMTVKTKLGKLTSSISDAVMPHGLMRKFPYNHMQTMTISGAKGSAVNARQISCALGQQELEGRRVPVMVSGKTLPSFKPFETKAIAGGYVASRFLTGVKPQEFYFHCMAGREGLIDTAVKTSRSGYLQRCLIKHLEGIRVHYDHTVRGSDSSVYQFFYGGDGLDVTKQKHLYQFEFYIRNETSVINRYQPEDVRQVVDPSQASDYMKKVLKKSMVRTDRSAKTSRDAWETPLSMFNPSQYLGSTSEKFADAVRSYVKSNPHKLLKSSHLEAPRVNSSRPPVPKARFQDLLNVKYMRSLVEPGEAVGLLASQGVGEPSTQMTLNTFHFAGHGAANVTLGIPRLREIVMTASAKPKTPSMTMKVRAGVPQADVDDFCKRASRLTLSKVVDNVSVRERISMQGSARTTSFDVKISFFPKEEYQSEYDVEPVEILSCFRTRFPLILKKEMLTEMKRLDADLKAQISELGRGKKPRKESGGGGTGDEAADDEGEGGGNADGADDASEVGDGDADAAKRQRQKADQDDYESDSEEEEDDGQPFDDDAINKALESGSEDEAKVVVDRRTERRKKKLRTTVKHVESIFVSNLPQADNFQFEESYCSFTLQFGASMPKLLLVGIVERTCLNTVIREIPGITDCFQVKQDNKKGDGVPVTKLTTNGSNLTGMWMFASASDESILEDDDICSNDIYAVLKAYGVEMARATILTEVSGVFKAYNIDVDRRHLELIADYMTFDGGYKPFNRKGISSNSSPLLKASFETTASFISDATLFGDYDDLTSPSGNIVLGRPNLTGTGVFDILSPIQAVSA